MRSALRAMFFAAILSLLGVTALYAQAIPHISGGLPARQGDHPWSAFVSSPVNSFSATLINEEWLLTAAHGISNSVPAEKYSIQLGGVDKDTSEPGEIVVQGLYKVVHPLYDPETGDYDLGLIKLSRPISETEYIKPLGLYTQTDELTYAIIITATVSGWGKSETGENSGLRTADVVYICRLFGITNLKCSSPYTPEVGVCVGDTGATLEVEMPDGTHLLRAPAWGGNQCDAEKRFNNFSYLTHETVEWVDGIINSPKYIVSAAQNIYMPWLNTGSSISGN